jgi:hypothetical protein
MIKNKTLQTDISLVLGLFAYLYLSHAFDKVSLDIPSYDIHGSPYYEILKWFYPVATLFVGAVALLLFWLMQNKLQHRKWVEILYLTIGLFIAFAFTLSSLNVFQPLLSQYAFGSSVPLMIWLQNTFWINTYLHIAGCLVGVIGLLLLLLPRNEMSK